MAVSAGKGMTTGFSLFWRLLLSLIGTVLLLVGALTFVFYVYSKRNVENQTLETIQQQFQAIGFHFRYELKDVVVKDLLLLASDPILDEYIMSAQSEREVTARSIERAFLESLKYSKSYEGISFVNYAGREVIRVDWSGRVKTYRNFVRNPLFLRVKEGRPGVIDQEMKALDKLGTIRFDVAIFKTDPDIGKFGGMVMIEHNLNDFMGYLDRIKIFDENPLWLFLPDGTLVKQPRAGIAYLDPRPLFTKELKREPALTIGQEGLVMYQDLFINPDKPLFRIAISIPRSLLLRDVEAVLKFFLIVALAALLIISIIAYSLASYLSRPIIELAGAASRLAKGDLFTRVTGRSSGEVQLLIDSFNRMAEDLEKTTVSKNYVDDIIGSMRDTLIVATPAGRISRINMAASFLLGYDESELVGQPLSRVVLDETDSGSTTLMTILNDSSISTVEKQYLTKNGARVPVLFSAAVMRNAESQIQGVVCVAQDITARRKAEDALRESAVNLNATLNATADGILAVGGNGKVLFFNQRFTELWNIPRAVLDTGDDNALLGHVLMQLSDPDSFIKEVKRLYNSDESSFDTIYFKDNRVFERYSFSMLQEKSLPLGRVWSFRDISERKKTEQKLQAYSLELEKINEELRSFAYIVSHDLRAPLVNIRGFSEELIFGINVIVPLLDKYLNDLDPKERETFGAVLHKDIPEALAYIKSSVTRMDNLIGAILKLSRAGRRTLNPEPLNTRDLVREILSSLTHQIGKGGIRVSADGLPDVITDRTALEQIFGNLIDNAIKYLEPGRAGEITISAEQGDDETVFHVGDNGRGMAVEDIPRAFEIFRRVGRQDVPGEGMGLAYVKILVRLLGGRIWCVSKPGVGTTFSFTVQRIGATASDGIPGKEII